ncbi:MAG TPA: glycosyltransferase family 2 protein, partial [Candidatus Paceibacterota bacterium]|nr:glycosyltransferase family 2 protein [Candidatus Paceibacterota bacterium]
GDFEIVVADGMSDDGTRDVLREIARANPRVRVIDNPARFTPAGLNAAIGAAAGDILVRMDAHTQYAPDYLRQCVAVLQSTGADNVGGPWIAQADSYVGEAIAAAFQSRFAAGGARSHVPGYEGEVDTVYLGCWKKDVFRRFGGFDESLARNQDDEHNLRIIRGGGRIWQSSKIRSWYHSRTSLKGLFRQYLQYGYWKVQVIRKHGKPASFRHLVPGIFVFTLLLLCLISGVCIGVSSLCPATALPGAVAVRLLLPAVAVLAILASLYVLALLVASLQTARRTKWNLLPALPLVFCCYHFGYGLGFLKGILDFAVLKRPAPASMSGLTRESAAQHPSARG